MSTTSETEKTPAVSRPEGGRREDDTVVFADGAAYRRGGDGIWDGFGILRIKDTAVDRNLERGIVAYVHAPREPEPEPVMEPLPTEPGSVVRATFGNAFGTRVISLCKEGYWSMVDTDRQVFAADIRKIITWEPLLSRAEWAEQDGDTVRVPRKALEDLQRAWSHQHVDGSSTLVGHLHEFLAVVSERGDQA